MSCPNDAEYGVKQEGGLKFILNEVEYSMWKGEMVPAGKKDKEMKG